MGVLLFVGLALAGAVAVDLTQDTDTQYGLAPDQHARKVHPWTVRLDSAKEGLEAALQKGDRAAILSGYADVWFWIGRVVCDALSASEDPIHGPVVSAAGLSVHNAWRAAQKARTFLGSTK